MALLVGFAFLAGAGTALSPCVLPVLPALLSAGGVGGHRRPLGVVLGLALTFTITIVGVAKLVDGVGLGTDPLRGVAVAILIGFGIVLLIPALGARLEAPLSRLAALGPRTRGEGFVSGLAVGGALGFVYTPCAGPILAAVISVGAVSGRTIAVGVAYAAGSALVLLGLMLGGRRLFARVRRAGAGPLLQRALGVIMLLTGVAIIANLDVNFDQFVARRIPDISLTAALERSHPVRSRLADISGRARFDSSRAVAASAGAGSHAASSTGIAPAASSAGANPHSVSSSGAGLRGVQTPALPALGAAPDFTGTQRWFNTPAGAALSLASLRGRVVLIDFWTYTCINCLRTLPYLEAWDARYRNQGLRIVGVHSPEFSFEHDPGNVANAIRQLGIHYPVVQDNRLATWDAWGNQAWPAEYLVDARGQVRHTHFGEGEYAQSEAAIRALLAEAGQGALGAAARPQGVVAVSDQVTPETYLGSARAAGWVQPPTNGWRAYPAPPGGDLALNGFAYSGRWRVTRESATAISGAGIDAHVRARYVYLVLSSAGNRPRPVQVLLDGRPIAAAAAGSDVHGGAATVTGQRLYTLVSLPTSQEHLLSLRFGPGVSGYAFTFG